ncbi:MAG TPA: histone deacetylase [Deltaproteobacteria bacterium]|nr:histone deacetylase [Deltaproteobacteria bacterium]
MSKVGIVHDPRYLLHETGAMHPERPDRLRAIEKMLETSGVGAELKEIPARPATEAEILAVHSREHLAEIARSAEAPGVCLDADTFAGPHSYEAALLAAGGLLEAVDRVADREIDSAFALLRPPGHHAERDYAMGFCLFNNIAVAAEYLIRKHHYQKVAVMDFDVHHGNATQHMFYDRADVFYVSTHRYPFYPGTGAAEERGHSAGAGYNLNIPLAAGSGDEIYRQAFMQQVIPALREYRPDFLLVSAGFDAHRRDPLGGMALSDTGFRYIAEQLEAIAAECCGGKSVYTLEGGYDLEGLSGGVREVLNVLQQRS